MSTSPQERGRQMSTMYSIGQMNQLADALEKSGFSVDDVTKLRSFAKLNEIKHVLCGYAKIVKVKHIIDCDADPFVPNNWAVEEHIKGGQFEWDSAKVAIYLSKDQQSGKVIQGNYLHKELKGQPVLNANVLDYLLVHPELIPEDWKDKFVFFWGTIYRGSGGHLVVRCLHCHGDRWDWHYHWFDYDFNADNPAAVSTSN